MNPLVVVDSESVIPSSNEAEHMQTALSPSPNAPAALPASTDDYLGLRPVLSIEGSNGNHHGSDSPDLGEIDDVNRHLNETPDVVDSGVVAERGKPHPLKQGVSTVAISAAGLVKTSSGRKRSPEEAGFDQDGEDEGGRLSLRELVPEVDPSAGDSGT
ncbi:hypothetical protein M427DRAFT_32062 [Gonapodya prolifera JEL478]|uniref:Uncharacterized protein n=1 Tax=Gonapodya prolifera (strain JEL478) TaxID=1344416 RepID=A0A139AH61_GONPJ|nr:hypothetical protein M427DRAFT_32062 [Gonapodya prolifera JEL478]|eukprot:KXS15904.1 hypothetical protein M427DRAFT_32062 [Gonapodya prolifera JEL478]